jgi:hypothetical protein
MGRRDERILHERSIAVVNVRSPAVAVARSAIEANIGANALLLLSTR